MLQFLKYTLASVMGFLISIGILIIFAFFILFGAISTLTKAKVVNTPTNAVLQVTLDFPIKERSTSNPFSNFDFKSFDAKPDLGLDEILKNISRAKNDPNIKGIYLDLDVVQAGMATIEEIRNALLDFKTSKKFIYAYSEVYTQAAYYLASVADKVYLNPQGTLEFKGLKAEILFFKGALEKLELEPEIIRHGKFKSAIEPLIMDKMSPENRIQTAAFMKSIWSNVVAKIAESRNIEATSLISTANEYLVQEPEDAIKYKLADSLVYFDQFKSILASKLSGSKTGKVNIVKIVKYNDASGIPETDPNPVKIEKIAVVYAEGNIVDGEGEDDNISSKKLALTLRKAREDNAVKAIVLRINSPGGSALASEVIWREVLLAKKSKPVIVSMGDYAASGGYYISCAADAIVAEPTTITGSIGVFGVLLNGQRMLKNKLGITVDTVKTGKYADIGTFTRPMSAAERSIIQRSVERVYSTFVKRVAEGRNKSESLIDSLGQGRVWTGADAQKIGLVDELGGIEKAISMAAKKAKITDYKVVSLPEQKGPFAKILSDMAGETESILVKRELGASYKYYKQLQGVLGIKGIQARMPYELDIY